MTTVDQVMDSIFGGKRPLLASEFEKWARESRRFRTFAVAYHTKIRAKRKNVRDEGGMQDLRAELETAVLLLRSERFTLEYEKYAAAKQRGPDFTVTYRGHTRFNVEVRRIRKGEWDGQDSEARSIKLMAVLCEKLRQMPPSIVNLVWLFAEREMSEADLTRAVMTLRQLAELQVQEFFTRRGFASAADFFKQYQRLSGIVLQQGDGNVVWLNTLARHPVPQDIVTTIRRLETIKAE